MGWSAGLILQEAAESSHVFHVFLQLFTLRRLEHLWDIAKTAIAHDDAEGVEPDFALADVFVAIDA